MEQSTNYNFNLPSRSDETSADIDLISDNFRTVDDVVKQVQDDVSKIPTNLVNGSASSSLRGINAKAEGNGYKMGESAVATGYNTAARGVYSHAEGGSTNANGRSSHAEGQDTTASGDYSHAEGISTTAGKGSHAEGSNSNASGDASHAEGVLTTASGRTSHAEGSGTTASGYISHAEGWTTTASGEGSHAEGLHTTASGYISHAEGGATIASGKFQHVQGVQNIEDTNNRYAHIVGNGEGENRSNAHTLDWDGNAWFAGDVYVGGTSQDDENATKLSSVATDITQVKEKLDGIEEGANKTIVDSELSDTSTNPVQNKVVSEKIKNHASFLARTFPTDAVYLKLGTFTGDGLGGRAILTINGRKYWNTYEDGGLKVLTLSSSSSRINGTFYDFGTSNNNTNSTSYKTDDMEILIVCQKDYAKTKADIFIKFTTSCEYNSYFATVDYSDGCSWETDVKAITATDTDPTTDAQSYHTAPIKYIGDVYELRTPKEKAGSISHTAPYCQSELAIDDFTKLNDYRTIIGTISGINDWNNIISVRHRNGADDGSNYGMYLRSKLTGKSNLIWRQQTHSGWEPEKTLLDNSNYASYIPQATTSKDGLLSASDKSKLNTDLKNHTSFHFISATDYVEYIKLGKFTGDDNGGRAIFTINGKQGWNNKNDGGLKILTLSSNYCGDSTSNDIHTGGTFYTFGHSDDNASSVIEGITTDIVLVRASGYSTKEVDVYIKISPTKYISYLVTVDYSVGCSWTTSTQEITSSETSPTEGATSYLTVPKKHIADSDNLKELKTPKGAVTSNLYTAPYCQSDITVSAATELNNYRTTIGTATVSGVWNNIISVRHRNGGIAEDGQSYGMYLRAPMTYESDLKWRQQFGASWKAEKILLDSSNFKSYIPYETGTCTLSASNGTVSNATYSVVGNMVTLNFNIAPTGAGNVVVSGLPFTATKNQSGFASSTATFNITANQTSVSINSSNGNAEYCTVTYLK